MVQDTSIIKNKIVNFLENNGPSLPVHIAKHAETSMLFASAFLSELLSEQRIKISNMKVGSSPIYYIKKDDERLDKFSEYLKSKEKEAYQKLKENKFLKDEEEQPAIKVALREIKDFAKPFEKNNQLIWRYYTIPESEYPEEIKTQFPASVVSEVKETLSKNEEESKEKVESPKEPENVSSSGRVASGEVLVPSLGRNADKLGDDGGGENKPKIEEIFDKPKEKPTSTPIPKSVPSKEKGARRL